MQVDLSCFPATGRERKRIIYVRGLDPALNTELDGRGYMAIELNSLPRESSEDQVQYLLAKCQAIEERTITTDPEERKCLELEMRAYGLLDSRSVALKLDVSADMQQIEGLLGWGKSRHTLAGNSTVIAAAKPTKRRGKGKWNGRQRAVEDLNRGLRELGLQSPVHQGGAE